MEILAKHAHLIVIALQQIHAILVLIQTISLIQLPPQKPVKLALLQIAKSVLLMPLSVLNVMEDTLKNQTQNVLLVPLIVEHALRQILVIPVKMDLFPLHYQLELLVQLNIVLPVLQTVKLVMLKLMELKAVLNAKLDFILTENHAQVLTALELMEKPVTNVFTEKS